MISPGDHTKFAVFILTHGRPDRVYTEKTLRRYGYKGRILYIVDDGDKTLPQYLERYGEDVRVFSKKEIGETFDLADNFGDDRVIIFARNAANKIAVEEGLDYYIQFDDDYDAFRIRYEVDGQETLAGCRTESIMSDIFDAMMTFLDDTGVKTLAMGQGGDFIGGKHAGNWRKQLLRKAMNSFMIRTTNPPEFIGRINEDVNSYVTKGNRGELWLTVMQLWLNQKETQSNAGGMTDIYTAFGTYLKSFYTVMYAPSCTTIQPMGPTHPRLHHSINWNTAVPKILDPRHKRNAVA